MFNLIDENEGFQENIFTGEVSFYIDNHTNCHDCPILKAEKQHEMFNTRVTPNKHTILLLLGKSPR
jgi:hypothetical protein